jgi:hypothetical protein
MNHLSGNQIIRSFFLKVKILLRALIALPVRVVGEVRGQSKLENAPPVEVREFGWVSLKFEGVGNRSRPRCSVICLAAWITE